MFQKQSGQDNLNLLVVDDDPLMLAGYERLFNRERMAPKEYFKGVGLDSEEDQAPSERGGSGEAMFELTLCSQGVEAVEAVRQAINQKSPYASALIDIMMPPGFDGVETARRIRQLDGDLQIIFVTAYSKRGASDLFHQVGGPMLFFNKPFSSQELYQTVRNSIWSWNQAAQLKQLQQDLEYRVDLQTRRLQDRVQAMELLQQSSLSREERVSEMKQELYQLRTRRDLQLVLSRERLDTPKKVEQLTALRQLKLLLVDDSATVRASYQARLESIGYQVWVASSVEEGMEVARRYVPDLALIDYYMPEENGDELIRRMQADTTTESILPLLFTGRGDELLASEAGAVHWVNKDQELSLFLQKMGLVRDYLLDLDTRRSNRACKVEALLETLSSAAGLEQKEEKRRNRRVLLVDDEPQSLEAVRVVLEQEGAAPFARDEMQMQFQLTFREGGREAVAAALDAQRAEEPFAVAMIDMRMPGGIDGLETARQLRLISPAIEIIMMTAYSDYSLAEIRSVLGARFSFISKPFKNEDLLQRVVEGCAKWEVDRQTQVSNSALISLAEDMEREIVRRKETEAQLEQANRTKDEFLSSMSHELRTPLSTIIGYNELLMDDQITEQQRGMLENSLLAGNTLLRLVNDILDMSKIRAGKFEVSEQPFDLQKMLNDIYQLMSVSAESQGVKLTMVVEESVEGLFSQRWLGDEMRLSQVLFNLLSNAIKFSERQGEVVLKLGLSRSTAVQVSALTHFQISVQDEGVGMSEAVLKRLFKPFEQAESSTSRRFGGTGLGLYISQQLTKMMGGGIQVESREQVGSLFTVRIPLKQSEIEIVQSVRSEQSVLPQLQGEVLLAEDTRQLQRLAMLLIEKSGAAVDVANNGVEAVEMAKQRGACQRPYDLILMDMQMPEMDGIEATRILKRDGCQTPVVALTANVMDQHRELFNQAGCVGFLSKPIRRSRLYTVLQQHLQPAVVREHPAPNGSAPLQEERG